MLLWLTVVYLQTYNIKYQRSRQCSSYLIHWRSMKIPIQPQFPNLKLTRNRPKAQVKKFWPNIDLKLTRFLVWSSGYDILPVYKFCIKCHYNLHNIINVPIEIHSLLTYGQNEIYTKCKIWVYFNDRTPKQKVLGLRWYDDPQLNVSLTQVPF